MRLKGIIMNHSILPLISRRAALGLVTALSLFTAACTAAPTATTAVSTNPLTSAQTSAQGSTDPALTVGGETVSVSEPAESAGNPVTVEYSARDLETDWDLTQATAITYSAADAAVDGEGAAASGTQVTISSAGTYVISGSAEGSIRVDAPEDADVVLVLDGLDLTAPDSAALEIREADQVIVTLAPDSVNSLTDGGAAADSATADAADAALFSKADLTINGSGALKVTGNQNHGIVSKDDLKIVSASLTVTAVNDGLKGRDLVAIKSGNITIDAGGDGIQSSNDEDAAKGNVLIESGTLAITAGEDAIQAESGLTVTGGDLTLTSGGGSTNSSQTGGWGNWGSPTDTADSESAKGLKAGTALIVSGGTLHIDSSDDSIHANCDVTINGGSIEIASGDDAIHADRALTINDGDIYITTSFEGLEGATVTIRDGRIHVGALDDGINTSGGNDGSSVNGRPGQNGFASDGSLLTLSGGQVFIDAAGDGMDANGNIAMTGGTVLIQGPTNSGNGAVDYNGEFKLTGGMILATGSSGMAQNISTSSSQAAFLLNTSELAAGTLVNVSSSAGDSLITFTSKKAFSSILLSSPSLSTGETYIISTGGTASGTPTDGVVDGIWSGGTELTRVTLSQAQTTIGGMSGPGGGMAPGGRPGKRP